jgi:hypothetical protein
MSGVTKKTSKRAAKKESKAPKVAKPTVDAVDLKKKKKHRSKSYGTGRIRNVKFIKGWQAMDGFRLSGDGKKFLTMLLFRELSALIKHGQSVALDLDLKRVSKPIMNSIVRMRLSNALSTEFETFSDTKRSAFEAEKEAVAV